MRASIVLALFFGLVVILFQSWPFWQNAIPNSGGDLLFRDGGFVSDSNIHIALINELSARFPPTNFAQAGTGDLHNYHYYFDAFWALIGKMLPVSVFVLYYRIMPVVVSSLLVAAVYISVWRLSKDRLTAAVAILWVVFSSSFGILTMHFSNAFMTDQIYTMLVNPQGVTSLAVFLTLFICLSFYRETKLIRFLILFSILLGLSFGIKAHGGVVFAIASIVASSWFYIKDGDFKPLVFTAIGLGILLLTVASIVNGKAANLAFAPFWILDKMVGDGDRLNMPNLLLLKEHYLALHSWLHLSVLTAVGLLVYMAGGLGLRVVGFVTVGKWLWENKSLSPEKVFLLVAAAVSLVVPLLFNQSKSAYNIVQFTTYFTLFMGIAGTLTIFTLIRRFRLASKLGVVGIITLLGVLMIKQDIVNQFNKDKELIVISADTLRAADFVQKNTPPDVIFFLGESPLDRESLWFSVLTKRRTVYSGGYFIDLAGGDRIKAKLTASETDFSYLWTEQQVNLESVKIDGQGVFNPVYKNDSIGVYRKI